jgi:hypothetical protein
MPRALSLYVACALVCVACGETPTQPSAQPPSPRDPTSMLRRPVCGVDGSNVRCTVTLWELGRGERDVTKTATWLVSATPLSFTPTSLAAVMAPGVIVPRRVGDISIFVEHATSRTVANYSFAVGPERQAVPLAPYLMGFVSGPAAPVGIGGAKVEIVDGPDAGKSDTTRDNGYYFINHVRMDAPFTVRVSKPGFITVLRSHPGIVASGPTLQPQATLHVDLTPVP